MSYNDLVYAIAKRARELGEEKMDSLRLIAGYNCSSEYEARQKAKYDTRGQLIEEILVEEFLLENHLDKEIES